MDGRVKPGHDEEMEPRPCASSRGRKTGSSAGVPPSSTANRSSEIVASITGLERMNAAPAKTDASVTGSFFGMKPGWGMNAALADGSVRNLAAGMSGTTWWAACTPNARDLPGNDW